MIVFDILINRVEYFLSLFYTYLFSRKNIIIGTKTLIYYRCHINNKLGCINIGNSCLIGRSKRNYHAGMPFYTTLFVDKSNASIKIGDNCRINGAYIHAQERIIIGDKCVIASGVHIIDSNGHELYSADRTQGRDCPKQIIIGKNVWIGINSIILKGSVIGDNSVVAAGSVVKGFYPKNSLIQGNPAKRVKDLSI